MCFAPRTFRAWLGDGDLLAFDNALAWLHQLGLSAYPRRARPTTTRRPKDWASRTIIGLTDGPCARSFSSIRSRAEGTRLVIRPGVRTGSYSLSKRRGPGRGFMVPTVVAAEDDQSANTLIRRCSFQRSIAGRGQVTTQKSKTASRPERQLCANTGRSQTARRTGEVDQRRPQGSKRKRPGADLRRHR